MCTLMSHLSLLCKRFLDVLNILFLTVPIVTWSSAIPLKLQQQIKNFNQNHHEKWLQTITKHDKNITHFAIRARVEDAPLVDTLLLHPILPHSLLPTLATHNEREVRPQSLRDPMRGRGPRSSRHLRLSILIFINYYKFLILWTMKLNELYTSKEKRILV